MQTKRLLDDRLVVVFAPQTALLCVCRANWEPVSSAVSDGRTARLKPEELRCYIMNVNRTDRGRAKELLRSFGGIEDQKLAARLPETALPAHGTLAGHWPPTRYN